MREQSNPKYSFIMPVYKGKFLKQAIESVLSQSFKDFELVIVNDASPDNLYDIVSLFEDSRISYYVNKINIGGKNLIKNWNKCLQYVHGQYFILASDDDLYKYNFLEEIDKLLQVHPQCNIVRSRVERIDSRNEITSIDYLYPELMTQKEFIYFWSKGMIKCISNYVFNYDSFCRNGGFVPFPLAWFSDDATVIKMSREGVLNTNEILFQFRSSDINISMLHDSKTLKLKLRATELFYKWIGTYLETNNLIGHVYMNPTFNIHNYLTDMILKITLNLKYCDFLYLFRFMYNNKILYKREKLFIFINYIFKN